MRVGLHSMHNSTLLKSPKESSRSNWLEPQADADKQTGVDFVRKPRPPKPCAWICPVYFAKQ